MTSRTRLFITAAALAGLAWPAAALGITRARTDRVSSTSAGGIDDAQSETGTDDTTLLIGLEACRAAVRSNSNLRASFETTLPLTNENVELYTFSTPAGRTGAVNCPEVINNNNNDDDDVGCTDLREKRGDFGEMSMVLNVTDLTFSELTGIDEASECEGINRDFFLRISIDPNINNDNNNGRRDEEDIQFTLDTTLPGPAELEEVFATESGVTATLPREPMDAEGYVVVVLREPLLVAGQTIEDLGDLVIEPRATSAARNEGGKRVVSVGGFSSLQPGETVHLAVAARDRAKNVGPLSMSLAATVLDETDFWESYKAAGGAEEGGYCQAGGRSGAPLSLGALLLMMGAWRLRRRALPAPAPTLR